MMILTNAIFEKIDEGCLKVAYSLVKRLKAANPDIPVVTYTTPSFFSDQHFEVNKLLLDRRFLSYIRKQDLPILYIPFPARTFATALRLFVLSVATRRPLNAVMVMKSPMSWAARALVRFSGANIIVFSKDAKDFYDDIISPEKVIYLKTGVDTEKFKPNSRENTKELKAKYGFAPDRPLVLHVGHLKHGRGVAELLKIDSKYQVLLVASTLTKDEQDQELRDELLKRPNIRIMDEYIPNIEQIYQMADVYFFPVCEGGNCIDVPLSCLEAAACGKPVVTTDYGEMREFLNQPGFYHMKHMDEESLNRLIDRALENPDCESRRAVLEYDWDHAVGWILDYAKLKNA